MSGSWPLASTIARFLWPPWEVRLADRSLTVETGRSEEIVQGFLEQLRANDSPQTVISEIDTVATSEHRRRELIETKSASLLGSLGVVMPLILIVPAVLGRSQGISVKLGVLLAIVFTLAVIHFLVAVIYSVRVSAVGALYLPAAKGIDDLLRFEGGRTELVAAASRYAATRLNEPILTRKTNYLAVAQQMYLRGVFFLAIGAVASFFYYYTTAQEERAVQPMQCCNVFVRPEEHPHGGPFE